MPCSTTIDSFGIQFPDGTSGGGGSGDIVVPLMKLDVPSGDYVAITDSLGNPLYTVS